jgi:hypothetical protein
MKDLTGNNELSALCADWLEAKKQLAKYTKIEKDAKQSIVTALLKHETDEIICGRFEITKKTIKGCAGKEISFEDIGKIIGTRKEAVSITINEIERK